MTAGRHRRPRRVPKEFHGILTVAPEMELLFEQLERAARSEAAILIRGETGTGKELVARAIHELSSRARGPFAALNCATLTGEMMASELFGHVKGAFTGAVRDRPGLFRRADGGSLFLDEIAEMPLEIQARVLRVLQEQRFVPLGGTDPVSVDVRILSATHQALRESVELRRFREDLMYRVRVIPLFLPALIERSGDVEALTWAFIDNFNERSGGRHVEGIERSAYRALMNYRWPGNVRELRNAIEFAFVMGDGPSLRREALPPELSGLDRRINKASSPRSIKGGPSERRRILDALQRSHGRKGDAAELLGMSRSTLWRKMRELRLEA